MGGRVRAGRGCGTAKTDKTTMRGCEKMQRKGFTGEGDHMSEYDDENPPTCDCGWNPIPCVRLDDNTWMCVECDTVYDEYGEPVE